MTLTAPIVAVIIVVIIVILIRRENFSKRLYDEPLYSGYGYRFGPASGMRGGGYGFPAFIPPTEYFKKNASTLDEGSYLPAGYDSGYGAYSDVIQLPIKKVTENDKLKWIYEGNKTYYPLPRTYAKINPGRATLYDKNDRTGYSEDREMVPVFYFSAPLEGRYVYP